MSLFIVKGKLKKYLNFLALYFVFLEFAKRTDTTLRSICENVHITSITFM